MRYFRVFTGRYGGELTIGKITDEEFADFSSEEYDEYDIGEHFGEWDRDLQWHEIDDIEHLNGPYSDNKYYVMEEDADGNEIGEELGPFDYNHLYGREAYTQSKDMLEYKKPEDDVKNVLQFFSEEKGSFGQLIIETEGDFDPDKLYVGVCETDLAELIESYFYDKIEVEPDFDFADTIGKAYRGSVGKMIMRWHDRYDQLDFDELWEYTE